MQKILRIAGLVLADVVLINIAYMLAFVLKFEFDVESVQFDAWFVVYVDNLLPITVCSLLLPALFGSYTAIWRYAGRRELVKLILGVWLGSAVTAEYMNITGQTMPTSIYIIAALISTLFLPVLRALIKEYRRMEARRKLRGSGASGAAFGAAGSSGAGETLQSGKKGKLKNVVVLGADETGAHVIRALRGHCEYGRRVVALIDDDAAKLGRRIDGVKVAGGTAQIPDVAKAFDAEEIIIGNEYIRGLREVSGTRGAHEADRARVTDSVGGSDSASEVDKASVACGARVDGDVHGACETNGAYEMCRKNLEDVVNMCAQTGCKVKLLPSLSELLSEKHAMLEISREDVERLISGMDAEQPGGVGAGSLSGGMTEQLGSANAGLLSGGKAEGLGGSIRAGERAVGRASAFGFDEKELRSMLSGRVVLVTGGGGRIGGELCRQIARLVPRRLVVLDVCEGSACELERELRESYPKLEIEVVIGSTCDREYMKQVMARFVPHVIFHLAAYSAYDGAGLPKAPSKELAKRNLLSAQNMLELAEEYAAERLVLIEAGFERNCSGKNSLEAVYSEKNNREKTFLEKNGLEVADSERNSLEMSCQEATFIEKSSLKANYPEKTCLESCFEGNSAKEANLKKASLEASELGMDSLETSCPEATGEIEALLKEKSLTAQNTRFFALRLGLVLTADSPMIKKFKRQIASGGPVFLESGENEKFTDAVAYEAGKAESAAFGNKICCISARQATQAILEACIQAEQSEENGLCIDIDMGEPKKLYDIACGVVRLAGYIPGVDIEIKA